MPQIKKGVAKTKRAEFNKAFRRRQYDDPVRRTGPRCMAPARRGPREYSDRARDNRLVYPLVAERAFASLADQTIQVFTSPLRSDY
jgi:hypothetical protein